MSHLVGYLLAFLSVAGFASTFVFGSELTKTYHISSEVLAFMRFAIAGGVMLGCGCARAKTRQALFSVPKRDVLTLLWLGPVGTCIMAWCVFMGCERVSTANASMADALTPLMIFVVAALGGKRFSLKQYLGLGCGLIGALLVIQIVSLKGIALSAYTLGDVYVLLAAATWGVYTVYGRSLIKRLGSSVFTTWTMLIGAVVIGVFLPFMHLTWPTGLYPWFLILLLGLVSTLMSFWTWNAAQKFLPMSVLGITAYFTPVVAVALAWWLLGERATALQWLGTLFIIASAAVEGRRK